MQLGILGLSIVGFITAQAAPMRRDSGLNELVENNPNLAQTANILDLLATSHMLANGDSQAGHGMFSNMFEGLEHLLEYDQENDAAEEAADKTGVSKAATAEELEADLAEALGVTAPVAHMLRAAFEAMLTISHMANDVNTEADTLVLVHEMREHLSDFFESAGYQLVDHKRGKKMIVRRADASVKDDFLTTAAETIDKLINISNLISKVGNIPGANSFVKGLSSFASSFVSVLKTIRDLPIFPAAKKDPLAAITEGLKGLGGDLLGGLKGGAGEAVGDVKDVVSGLEDTLGGLFSPNNSTEIAMAAILPSLSNLLAASNRKGRRADADAIHASIAAASSAPDAMIMEDIEDALVATFLDDIMVDGDVKLHDLSVKGLTKNDVDEFANSIRLSMDELYRDSMKARQPQEQHARRMRRKGDEVEQAAAVASASAAVASAVPIEDEVEAAELDPVEADVEMTEEDEIDLTSFFKTVRSKMDVIIHDLEALAHESNANDATPVTAELLEKLVVDVSDVVNGIYSASRIQKRGLVGNLLSAVLRHLGSLLNKMEVGGAIDVTNLTVGAGLD
ncbi:hypothetical protein BC940DRAFT_323498 [Gongronella butleri]|nr:hypothetical protein BC940DRAFT_323498 [Gongronella butleri]